MRKAFAIAATILSGALLAIPAMPQEHAGHGQAQTQPQKAEKKVKDPVCGMEVNPKSAAAKSSYKGKTYYFCSVEDKGKFDKSPAQYVK